MTRHHICPKIRGWLNEHENIKMLEMNVHRRLHDFFGVKLPHEQLQQVIDIAKTALSPWLHRDLTDVLEAYRNQQYLPWVMRNWVMRPNEQ